MSSKNIAGHPWSYTWHPYTARDASRDMRAVGYTKSKRSDLMSQHHLSSDKPCGAILNEMSQITNQNGDGPLKQWIPTITWWRYKWDVRPTRHPHLPLNKETTAAFRRLGGESLGPTFRLLLSREMGPPLRWYSAALAEQIAC
jgi:hypothetical protein